MIFGVVSAWFSISPMEVHAPHHPLNSWRDFFVHIATIVVGLLIAIGLEQTVEWFHHRHVVHVARENIRQELERNKQHAAKNLVNLETDAKAMQGNIEKARLLRDNPKALEHGEFKSEYSWESFSDSAWTSARDAGALPYMPADEVARYDDVYEQQARISGIALATFTKQLELATPFVMENGPENIKPEDVHRLLRDTGTTYIRLTTLHEYIEGLEKQYDETLKQ